MIGVKRGIRAEEVRRQQQHVLFVEGHGQNSIDPKVLNELFHESIRIEPMGASFSIKSVAEALFSHHPTYYFLIDRDHHQDCFIDSCWSNFPNPSTNNLLVWRRREIENYFLDPDYLFHSQYCTVSQAELTKKILDCVNDRLFMDVANHVIISIREELKKNWIEKYTNHLDFPDKETALIKLKSAEELGQHCHNVQQKVSPEEIETRFNSYYERMTGGSDKVIAGCGDWLSMTQGKKVLSQVINSNCFRDIATNGSILNGAEKLNEVVRDLLRRDDPILPSDFVQLKQLISSRLTTTNA